jgi:nitrogen fixation NifU-like protein
MRRSRGAVEPTEALGDAAAFRNTAKYVMRIKCAMLAWVALEADLRASLVA